MSFSPESRPPRWADRLLKWYCRPELLEDLQGDLYEFFYRRVDAKGARNARWNYILDVLKFFRLYTVKQLKIPSSMNFLYLWKSYLKTSSRSIARNKLFSSINIIGLSISMTVGVLMIIMVSELLSFDRFHDQYDNIYRITNHSWDHQDGELDFASTSAVAGYELMNGHSAIDQVVLIRRHFGGVASYGEKSIAISGHWASKEFFNLFSFDLLHGNPATALAEPNSIVLTEKTAGKLFGDEDPMGKTIELGNREMSSGIVTGIVADPPLNSHIQFQALGSFDTYADYVRNNSGGEKSTVDRWNSMWMYHVYFRVQDPTRLADIQTFLDQVSDKYNEDDEYFKIYLQTQAMVDRTTPITLARRWMKRLFGFWLH